MSSLPIVSTAFVFSLFSKLEKTRILSTAITQRFDDRTPLDQGEEQALELMNTLGFVYLPYELNEDINSFIHLQEESNLAQQRLKTLAIRRKTLEMQLRNTQDELAKLGFFSAKNKLELEQKEKQFLSELNQISLTTADLQRKLELPDEQLKKLAERLIGIQGEEEIKYIAGKAVMVKKEAELLLEELKQMHPQLIQTQPLAQILQYGFAWTAELNQQ
jgi:hypothetical protein